MLLSKFRPYPCKHNLCVDFSKKGNKRKFDSVKTWIRENTFPHLAENLESFARISVAFIVFEVAEMRVIMCAFESSVGRYNVTE